MSCLEAMSMQFGTKMSLPSNATPCTLRTMLQANYILILYLLLKCIELKLDIYVYMCVERVTFLF